jgi:hypothetical protein
MAIATFNWTWQQGADLVMSFIYKEGPDGAEVPVNLTGYKLRMDIVSGGVRIFTFNSDDIAEAGVDTVGAADNEAVLGADGSVNITVPRSLTLDGGAVEAVMTGGSTVLQYDVFLRNPAGKQGKILKGVITVEPSYTLWQ